MIGLYLLAAHMAGDFLFQIKWIADNKLYCWHVRIFHCWIYTICFMPVIFYSGLNSESRILFYTLLFVTHFIADSREWASNEHWQFKSFFVDQSIHIITLAVLGAMFHLN